MDIYVQKDGQKRGPFSEAQIRTGIDRDVFKPDDPAWTTGKVSWQPLSALINLDVNQPPPLDHEPASSAKADIPKTASASAPRIRGDAIRKTIALLAVGFVFCLLLAFGWQSWSSDHVDAKTWAAFNVRQGFGTPKSDPSSPDNAFLHQPQKANSTRIANLRSSKEDFIALYGQPKKAGKAEPPATDYLDFLEGDLVYTVSFWNGSAHRITAWRYDNNPLTDQDIKKILSSFSDGDDWIHQDRDGTDGRGIWRRAGVTAIYQDMRHKIEYQPEKIPASVVEIMTDEFLSKKGSEQ